VKQQLVCHGIYQWQTVTLQCPATNHSVSETAASLSRHLSVANCNSAVSSDQSQCKWNSS